MFTVRAAFGLSALALVAWTCDYSMYFTGRRYPWWLSPFQGDDGRQVAALHLTAIVGALAVFFGAGFGWLVASALGWPLASSSAFTAAAIAAATAVGLLAPRARKLWGVHAARIDDARACREACREAR